MFIKGLSIDWNKIDETSYLRKIDAICDVENLIFNSPVTFFVGENGSGKSTLLEAMAIAEGFNPEGRRTIFHRNTFADTSWIAGCRDSLF